jgi:hypothetical protein
MSQPGTGINQKPLVFAQIRKGSSAPKISNARVVESSRVIDISSNRFLHLFYRKPHMKEMGYDHGLDGLSTFRIKTAPDANAPENAEMLAAGPLDTGTSKSVSLSERQFLTLSDCDSWEYKPSVKVADFFANSLGVPIECWTPCSRIQMSRELDEADLLKYELECGAGVSQDCAMTAGELALALNNGDAADFDPYDDLHGEVQLSVIFVNAHPKIQPLDFRLRMNIKRCECEPICFVHADNGKLYKLNGKPLNKTVISRLGYGQTCLAVAFEQNDSTTHRTPMKYCLFPNPPRCAFEYTIDALKSVPATAPVPQTTYADWTTDAKSGENHTTLGTPLKSLHEDFGMSNKLATTDVWCSRSGEVFGITRCQRNSDGDDIPVFGDVTLGTTRCVSDAAAVCFKLKGNEAYEEHKAYYTDLTTTGTPITNGSHFHWRDYCHYAGNNANSWGASTGQTVVLNSVFSSEGNIKIVNNGTKALIIGKSPKTMFDDLEKAKDDLRGTIHDTGGGAGDLPKSLDRLI